MNGVEFSFYHNEDILETTTFSIIPFMIKTHSVCVYGGDLNVHLPIYKADKTLSTRDLFPAYKIFANIIQRKNLK